MIDGEKKMFDDTTRSFTFRTRSGLDIDLNVLKIGSLLLEIFNGSNREEAVTLTKEETREIGTALITMSKLMEWRKKWKNGTVTDKQDEHDFEWETVKRKSDFILNNTNSASNSAKFAEQLTNVTRVSYIDGFLGALDYMGERLSFFELIFALLKKENDTLYSETVKRFSDFIDSLEKETVALESEKAKLVEKIKREFVAIFNEIEIPEKPDKSKNVG